jgi:DNA-binding NtrC family response regulator
MKKSKVLIFSSDQSVISPLKEFYDVEQVLSRTALLKKIEQCPNAVLDFDNKELKDVEAKGTYPAITFFKELMKNSPNSKVLVLSSSVTIPEAVEAAKIGILNYLKKPVIAEKLIDAVKNDLLKEEAPVIKLDAKWTPKWLLGTSNRVKTMFKALESAMHINRNILFIAEQGVDVGGIVDVLHHHLGKTKKMTTIDLLPFEKENAENIFWTLLQESLIHNDMIYLKNFDSVLNEKTRTSITDYIKSRSSIKHIRVLASVLRQEESLAFNEWEKIHVPALRERKEDLPSILEGYVDLFSKKYGKHIHNISLEALSVLSRYSWPGNYRELETVIENAILICQEHSITLKCLNISGKMVFEGLSSQNETLIDFKGGLEKSLINIYFRKTGSAELTASLLDMPMDRVSNNLLR